MPEKFTPPFLSETSPTVEQAKERSSETFEKPMFRSLEEAKAYQSWRKSVPREMRRLVEGHMLGQEAPKDKTLSSLVSEFYDATRQLLLDPNMDISTIQFDTRVKNVVGRLQNIEFVERPGEFVNVFSLLVSADIGFDTKRDYYEKQIRNRLAWLVGQDRQEFERHARSEQIPEVKPSDEPDEYTPHRAPEEKSEGEPGEAVALVYPFFGGYYGDGAFTEYDPGTMRWKKEAARYEALADQRIDQDRKRAYRGSAKGGRSAVVKLPTGWGVSQESMQWMSDAPSTWSFSADQKGFVTLSVEGDKGTSYPFQIEIGPSNDALIPQPPSGSAVTVRERFPEELDRLAQEYSSARLPKMQKARKIVSAIRRHLEYDKSFEMEAIYKADPSRYFETIWEHKKAKCDEANTIAARALTKMGYRVEFVPGHSVQSKSENGWAQLLDSNRHAWLRVWDEEASCWARMDATPKGDPNVDSEDQERDLGEGDYGEQEAELMSEEELQKVLEKFLKEQEKPATAESVFAEKAGCSEAEARLVLEKILGLRERHRQTLKDSLRYWQSVVRKNLREHVVETGPVPLSQADDIDDRELVSGYIDSISGDKDPVMGTREKRMRHAELSFGGNETYLAVDLSGSMNEEIEGVSKREAQRDMAFLYIDSIMQAASEVKKVRTRLKSPMPTKICLATFGAKTEIALPLTSEWGPAEQLQVYRTLDAGAGSGTPDHLALNMIGGEIEKSRQEEAVQKAQMKVTVAKNWQMHRFVVVIADGGSDNSAAVKQMNDQLAAAGIPVDLFLIASDADVNLKTASESAYQSVSVTPNPADLANRGLSRLTERMREAYGVQGKKRAK